VKEQTKIRLDTITRRYARRMNEAGRGEDLATARHAAFQRGFERARKDVLRPAMCAIGVELTRSGHSYTVEDIDTDAQLSIDFRISLSGSPAAATGIIRLFSPASSTARPEVIAELELNRNPMELTRYFDISDFTTDVVEQMLVDAIEQLFACNGG
jgi:hypothetical protein